MLGRIVPHAIRNCLFLKTLIPFIPNGENVTAVKFQSSSIGCNQRNLKGENKHRSRHAHIAHLAVRVSQILCIS